MAFDPLTAVLNIGGKVLDKVLPDPEEKARAKLEMARLAQDEKFRELETSMKAIIAEAQSSDPWTSRARPSFLYVMYIMILAGIRLNFVEITMRIQYLVRPFFLHLGAFIGLVAGAD